MWKCFSASKSPFLYASATLPCRLCATQQQLGQLPTAFEADERACPSLSIDLLRLVHGRTLLGMVRPMQPLQLQSGEMAGVHAAGLPQTDERRSARELLAGHALLPGASHSTTAPGNDAAVSDAAWTELLQLCYPLHGTYAWAPVPALQQQQLQCTHAGPGTAPPAALWTTAVATSCSRVNDDDGCATQQDTGLPPAADDAETFVPGTLGGGAAQRKWEAAWEAQYGHDAAGCVATSPLCDRQQQKSQQQQQHRHRSQQHHHQQSQQRHHHQSQPHHHQQQQSQQLHQRLWRWLRRPTPEWSSVDWSFNDASDHVLVLQLLQQDGCISALAVRDETQAVKPIKVSARKGVSVHVPHAGPYGGICVFLALSYCVSGSADATTIKHSHHHCCVSVADMEQVYVRGTFVAALLDGKVLEPLTGRCLAVSCSYTTPGVKQLIFLAAAVLPGGRGAGRLLARCQRRWMPPSSTWLFPPLCVSCLMRHSTCIPLHSAATPPLPPPPSAPVSLSPPPLFSVRGSHPSSALLLQLCRSDAHDRGGWLIEWEGHSRELESTSWLHPAVYVLACGVTSHDLEVRRTARRAARAQHWHWLSAPLATLRRACAPMLVWQWGT